MRPTSVETVLYISEPYKKYRWVTYYSIFQVGFFAVTFIFLPTQSIIDARQKAMTNRIRRKEINGQKSTDRFEDEFEPNPDYDSATIFERFKRLDYRELFSFKSIYNNVSERPYVTLGLIGASALISSAFWMYARRTIHKITLLPNEYVRFNTFSPFAVGKPPTIEVPLRHVSCVTPRKSPNNYSILKIKDRRFFFLVHKSEGLFIEPKLYDLHLGFSRNWEVAKQH